MPPAWSRKQDYHRPTAMESLDKDPKIREMYQAGASDQDIADATGWAKRTVCKWRQNHGLPANRKNGVLVAKEAKAIRLYQQGFNDRAIAGAIGCSSITVYRWRERTGRPSNNARGMG